MPLKIKTWGTISLAFDICEHVCSQKSPSLPGSQEQLPEEGSLSSCSTNCGFEHLL